jgi:hypothetical protein
MTKTAFLLLGVALAFYNVGAIWAHEVDIFRTWKLIDPKDFAAVQTAHWRKLPYWIFAPVWLALIGSTALIWYHPVGSPGWAIGSNVACQTLAIVLTALLWGRQQAELSRDPACVTQPLPQEDRSDALGANVLINVYAFIMS